MFDDRRQAARALAAELARYKRRKEAVILAIPRGGVEIGAVSLTGTAVDRGLVARAGKTVILTDDGAATGRTLLTAVEFLRRDGAEKIVAAVPIASPDALADLEAAADETVCLESPAAFSAISASYRDFAQISDAEAAGLLRRRTGPGGPNAILSG